MAALKLLNQEFSPHLLFGTKPPDEGELESDVAGVRIVPPRHVTAGAASAYASASGHVTTCQSPAATAPSGHRQPKRAEQPKTTIPIRNSTIHCPRILIHPPGSVRVHPLINPFNHKPIFNVKIETNGFNNA